MTTNLVESITRQLTPDMIQRIGALLNEAPAHTQKAVDGAIPTLLAGLIHLSFSGNGPTRLLDLIYHRNYGRLLNNLSGLLDGGNTAQTLIASGQDILSTLFAGKLHTVSELIATASGVTSTSASSLLSLTAPVVVGVVGRVRAAQGLNAASLTKVLMDQTDDISRQAPTGLAEVFGLSSIADLGYRLVGAVTGMTPDTAIRVAEPAREASLLQKWRWPVLIVVPLGLLYFLVGRDPGVTQSLMVKWAPAATPAVATLTLPDGVALSLKEGSFNYNVATFLADPANTTVPQTFVFDPLNFDSSTTHLTPESAQTVADLSAILQAYPATDVRLDGYTAGVGNAEGNKQLSLERVAVVKEALIRGGIGATRVTTAGYGPEHPLASNETEDGRARNRRLELVVVKK
jgi:outer membrane protein OmpA-like peptidoglycan-associated protein